MRVVARVAHVCVLQEQLDLFGYICACVCVAYKHGVLPSNRKSSGTDSVPNRETTQLYPLR